MKTKSFKPAALLPAILALALPASGDDRFWNRSDAAGNPMSGVFSEDANWTDATTPNRYDDIILDRGADAPYTITLDIEFHFVRTFEVRTDQVVFDLNGNHFEAHAPQDVANFIMGNESDVESRLVIEGGGTFALTNPSGSTDFGTLRLGNADGARTSLIIRGEGTVLDGGSSERGLEPRPVIGWDSPATVTVEDGARLILDGPILARGSDGAVGSGITVRGTDASNNPSELVVTGYILWIGRRADEVFVTIENGANLNAADADVNIGDRGGARLTIDNASGTVGAVVLGRWSGDPSTLNVLNGGELTTETVLLGEPIFSDREAESIFTVKNVGSKATVNGALRLGPMLEWVLDPDNASSGGDRPAAPYHYESIVNVSEGGELEINGDLTFNFSGTARIEDGLITAYNLEVGENDGTKFPTYQLVLTADSEAAAPLQVRANGGAGGANLSRKNLNLDVELGSGFQGRVNDVYGVLRYEGRLRGHFKDLPHRSTFTVGNVAFQIDYGAGYDSDQESGRDGIVTLTVIPEPSSSSPW